MSIPVTQKDQWYKDYVSHCKQLGKQPVPDWDRRLVFAYNDYCRGKGEGLPLETAKRVSNSVAMI